MRTVKVSAPGKIILSGEHAVVYGHPAILAAVNFRLSITGDKTGKKAQIVSNVPIGSGMGSSAAYAVATSAYKLFLSGRSWNLAEISKEAYKLEKRHHGNPSGGDNTVSTYGGFLWYRKEAESLKTFTRLSIKRKLPKVFLINSGRPKETTKEMVSWVSQRYATKPRIRSLLFDIEKTTRSFLRFLLKEENPPFGELLTENEKLLEKLGVVSPGTKALVGQIEKMGGAAKISGAGGRTQGSGILLVYHPDTQKLLAFAQKLNLKIFRVKLGEEGVRIEKKS